MATRGDTDDLAALSKLDEATLLEEIKSRYARDKIYTYVGDILIAVNPFKQLSLYSREQRLKYRGRGAQRSQNAPHIFATADAAYRQMVATGNNQCCVISGESGSGKTESCKFIVAELVELSHSKSVLEQKILQVNPLLEAFGNAMTLMNDNSSRFGKYIQLKFNAGHVTGAKINEYLLEKSRVVLQNSGEQNFHIFYTLFAGLEGAVKGKLQLNDPNKFYYLCEGAACLKTRLNAKKMQFEEVQNALDLVGFEPQFQEHLFTCLATVLHFGNIQFTEDDNEYAHVDNMGTGPIQRVSMLIGIDANHLADIMTVSVNITRGETIRKHLSKQKAKDARDALAKALYDRMFRWIVNRINQLLAPTAEEMVTETEIGILDIFGFEKFEQNGFEQICINLANEQLQFFFIEHIFTMEREEYKREGINVADIKFQDNKALLDMFLAKPVGLISLLDEQSTFPRATDETFVTKLNQAFKKKPFFIPDKGSSSAIFTIHHYAGKVEYDAWGFLERNRDGLPSGAIELFSTASNDLVKLLFMASITRTGTLAVGRLTSRQTGRLKKRTLANKKYTPAAKILTVGTQFKNSLQVLIEKMNAAQPHFVRCIKPNTVKAPNIFAMEYVSAQLRYTGLLETTRIRRDGYAFRPLFGEFVERYKTIAASPKMAVSIANCRKILVAAKLSDFQMGKTKVFLKYWHVEKLNELLEKVHQAAIVIQKVLKGFVQRKKFKVLLSAKKKQDAMVAQFLSLLPSGGSDAYSRLKLLNRLDLARTQEELSAAPVVVTTPVEPHPQPTPAPLEVSISPEPLRTSEDSEEEESEDVFNAEEDYFVAPDRNKQLKKKFGKEGTKNASVRWFKETQAEHLKSASGSYHEWFHGIITRRQAEILLTDKPNGSFLIRVSESRFGYSLSFRVTGRCKHYMISQIESGRYVIVGEPRVHKSLEELVKFHRKKPVNVDGDLLTLPCTETHDFNELEQDIYDEPGPPTIPPRTLSVSNFEQQTASSRRPRKTSAARRPPSQLQARRSSDQPPASQHQAGRTSGANLPPSSQHQAGRTSGANLPPSSQHQAGRTSANLPPPLPPRKH